MKKKVMLSTYNVFLSVTILAVLCGGLFLQIRHDEFNAVACLLFSIILILCGSTLLFSPLSVSLENNCLYVNFALRYKSFPLPDIESVSLCAPTMGAQRICGSGGFFGYYGWFSERDLGKYFAYHGKASDCFLVTLRNGKKYMLGCQDAREMVGAIRALLP